MLQLLSNLAYVFYRKPAKVNNRMRQAVDAAIAAAPRWIPIGFHAIDDIRGLHSYRQALYDYAKAEKGVILEFRQRREKGGWHLDIRVAE